MGEMTSFQAYEGRRLRGPDGQAYVVRNGKPVLAATALDPRENSRLDSEAARMRQMRDMLPYAQEFGAANQRRGTGGLLDSQMVPAWGQPEKQRMLGLSSKLQQLNRVPGQGDQSTQEMLFALQALPSVETDGPVNAERIQDMRDAYERQRALVEAMQKYAAENGNLTRFDLEYKPPPLRARGAFGRGPRPRAPGNDGVIDLGVVR